MFFKPKPFREVNPYVEIARSFSFKKNLGNYESADFFCSEKKECLPEEAAEVSEKVFNFCREQVFKDADRFMENRNKVEPPPTPAKKTFWDTPKGEETRERYQEIHQNFGEENGERGSRFE